MVRLILFLLSCIVEKVVNQDTFSAFTGSTRDPELKELEQLYQRLRNEEPHFFTDSTMNVGTKIKICQSIMKSGFFNSTQSKSINMDKVYPELKMNTMIQMQKAHPRRRPNHKMMRQDHELKSLLKFTYRTERLSFTLSTGEKVDEYAFACIRRIFRSSSREGGGNSPILTLYFISDVYNLSENPVDDGQIDVRLVCEVRYGECDFVGIAEQPAIAFGNAEYFVEDVYLRMRESHNAAPIALEDPLCRLTRLEKLRVCVVAMNSSYFNGKVEVFPDLTDFEDVCVQRIVSFRTEKAKGSGKLYSEWMFKCSVKPLVRDAHSEYFVSRAYQSHYVAIYSRQNNDFETESWYLENISGNTGVVVERKSNAITTEADDSELLSPPNLRKLLEESMRNAIE